MQFSGKNLSLIRRGLELALSEIHNLIAHAPDVYTYAEDIEEYEQEGANIEHLLARVTKVMEDNP